MVSTGSEHLVSTRIRAISLSVALMCCLVVGGCSLASQLPPTQPAGVTQQLMIRSLERALAQLDLGKLRGPGVNVDVFVQFVQNANQAFVKEFVTAWLQAHGVRTVSESPEIKVKLFASVYGTDSDHTLIGIPSFQAPVVNVPFPEIALFKWERNRGQAELRIYEFEAKTDTLLGMQAPGIGRAKYDNFTVLLFIGFTVSDVEKRE
ncbi:MAG TPA: hypothetical protein VGA23_05845 [Methylomirabilota bacterium]